MFKKKKLVCTILVISFFIIFLSSPLTQEKDLSAPGLYNTAINQQVQSNTDTDTDTKAYPDTVQFNEKKIGQYNVIGTILIFIWLAGVIIFYAWAIHFYVYNYGLSKWKLKLLYPEIFCRKESEKEKFNALRHMHLELRSREAGQAVAAPFSIPVENPYKNEALGLPSSTIRSTFALTCLFIFVVIEGLNLISPENLEVYYSEFIFILEMIFSFYFGAKVIDYFNKQKPKQQEPEAGVDKESSRKPAAENPGAENNEVAVINSGLNELAVELGNNEIIRSHKK